ncbi:uncharacterized protein JCM6883_004580 [Sporobolomyces salmoneus]|uniref:uncharacterized protein n=1 Tax=Sporobolomyces salmoneus TaxID=183962 RepID=UPI003173273B
MPKSTRLYTLCVLFLIAYHPPNTLAQFERVPLHQLDRRQDGFGGLFGGREGRGGSSDTTGTSVAPPVTTPTSAATQGVAVPTRPNPATVPSTSTPASSSNNGFGFPFFGGRSSSTDTSAAPDTTASASVTNPTSAAVNPSASSLLSDSASKETSAASQVIVTITSIVTNADGSHSTMVSQSASAVAAKQNDGGSGPSGKTWGIIGGVVGGVAVLIGAILILWRCTQRRFDNLDGNMDEIKWPELQPDGQTVSSGLATLNPAATRRTGRAGIEMEKDEGSEWGDDSPRLGKRPDGTNEGQYFDHPSAYEVNYNGHGSQRGSYYDDPYHGPGGATPYPPRPISYRQSSASPYEHYDGAVSNPSFRNSNIYGSNEDVPLVENRPPGVPILRVSSPVSQHRMS